ncbi:MAG: hypothetical protein AAF585_01410 [Verrucomicrobiota bacterium]
MAFCCPECNQPSLEITQRIELRADAKWDEIAVQLLRCSACDFEAIATYQENRWGATEIVHHFGFRTSPKLRQQLRDLIDSCKTPDDKNCECASCRELNLTDAQGTWNWLERRHGMMGEMFAMELAPSA